MASNVFEGGVLMLCSCIVRREDYLSSETFGNVSEVTMFCWDTARVERKVLQLPEVLYCVSKTHIINL